MIMIGFGREFLEQDY